VQEIRGVESSVNHQKSNEFMGKASILLLCGNLSYAGAQRQLFELAKGLNQRHNVVVCCIGSGSAFLREFKENKIRVEAFNLRSRNVIQVLGLLRSALRKNRIDIVYSFLDAANYFSRLIGLSASYVKIVVSERSSNYKVSVRRKVFEKILSKRTDLYISNSYAGQLDLKRRFGIGSSVVIHNGVDSSRFRDLDGNPGLRSNPNNVVISMVARIKPAKNHEMFLEVAERVCSLYKYAVFFAIGDSSKPNDPYMDFILRKHRELKNRDRIVFMGARSDIPDILSESDISILTSHTEGCSNSVLEAMFSKCPLAVTDVGDNKLILSDENKGFVSTPGNVDEMVKNVSRLIDQPKLRSKIGEANYQKAKREFTVEKLVDRTESVILKLLKS